MSKRLCHPSRNATLNNPLSQHPNRKIADIFESCDGTHRVETWLVCGTGRFASNLLWAHSSSPLKMTLLAKSLGKVLSKSNPTEHLPSVLPPPGTRARATLVMG